MRSATTGLALLVLAPGCDLVLGVSGRPDPCSPQSFEGAPFVEIAPAEDFSISLDRKFAVLGIDNMTSEIALPDGAPVPIDLGLYPTTAFGLAPEADALFYTTATEPPRLRSAVRASDGTWQLGRPVPAGIYAGVPSADALGPRRVLVRMREQAPEVQEYEDVAGTWMPVGDPQPVGGTFAPNLTASGLDMVYVDHDVDGATTVYVASRESLDEWFSEPTALLRGELRSPQLHGSECQHLFVSGGFHLRRYDR